MSYSRHFLLVATVEADERGDLVLKRTKDLGKTFTTIHEDIYSFGYIGAFLFFSVMEDSVRCVNTKPLLHVSIIYERQLMLHLYIQMRASSINNTVMHCSARRDPLVSCTSHQTKEIPSVEHCCPLPPLSR